MPNYIRSNTFGGTYFFTVNLQNRNQKLLTEKIDILRSAFRKTQTKYPFQINAITILPDHLHTIWTLPELDSDFTLRWRLIKGHFSRAIPRYQTLNQSRHHRGERGIWQRLFWEHQIRDSEDYRRHVEYCYINPVKHGYVENVKDWECSSFHRDVEKSIFPADWGR